MNTENTSEKMVEVKDLDSFLKYLDTMSMVISEMFGKNCEVVVSDLDNPDNTILSIYNGEVTGRKVGDPLTALANELIEKSESGYNINYRKANRRIKKEIKSSTIVTKAFGKNISFCINYDCDSLTQMQNSLKQFLSMGEEVYNEIDTLSNLELIENKFYQEVEKLGKPIVNMNKNDRIEMIRKLKNAGMFNIQKSVPFVAEKMGVSRYTIYNYLNKISEDESEEKPE